MKIKSFALATTAAIGVTGTAYGEGLELGATLGGHSFSSDINLGSTGEMDDPGPEAGPAIGLRLGYGFGNRFAIEGESLAIATQDDVLGDEATVYALRAHGRIDLLTGRLRPFLVAGLGALVMRTTSVQMDDDTEAELHWGGGIRFAVTPSIDLRADVRHLIVSARAEDELTSDLEITAGATYRFGAKQPLPPRRVAVVPPPAPAPAPPPVAVVTDRDGDGLLDADDKCPDEAETQNGWRDTDGCADEVIREVAGIGFETNAATIDETSQPILDKAYEILRDNEEIAVEITGHTSAEGGVAYNRDLSQRRADAVKAYLVKRGIAEARIRAVGHGATIPLADDKTEEGRRKNRRIEFHVELMKK